MWMHALSKWGGGGYSIWLLAWERRINTCSILFDPLRFSLLDANLRRKKNTFEARTISIEKVCYGRLWKGPAIPERFIVNL